MLFPSGDAQAMAVAAIRLLQDESLGQRVSKGAHELITTEYEIHSVAERLAALYRSLTDLKPNGWLNSSDKLSCKRSNKHV